MASIKFLMWNVHGIRDKVKRSAGFSFLKKQQVDILVLVETHVEGWLQMVLKRPWIGRVFHSTHTMHLRGVSMLIAKNLHFELHRSALDPQGRFVFLYATLYGEPILILAFYIPPPFCSTILTERFYFMAHHPTAPAVWMGDFNTTLIPNLDELQLTPPMQPGTPSTYLSLLGSGGQSSAVKWLKDFPCGGSHSLQWSASCEGNPSIRCGSEHHPTATVALDGAYHQCLLASIPGINCSLSLYDTPTYGDCVHLLW